MMKVLFVFFFAMTMSVVVFAQRSYSGGVEFELSPSFSFDKDWKLSTKLSPRFVLMEGSESESLYSISDYERTEFELVMSKGIGKETALGMGYLIRHEDGELIHRIIQQFELGSGSGDWSFGHRFRFDETFYAQEATSFRFRYRFSVEKTLKNYQGESKNRYLFLSNEYLPSIQDDKRKFEVRLNSGIGFQLDEKNALEIGIDYRIERPFQSRQKQLFLFNIAWSPSF